MTTLISEDGKVCESNVTRERAQEIADRRRSGVFFYDGSGNLPEKIESRYHPDPEPPPQRTATCNRNLKPYQRGMFPWNR